MSFLYILLCSLISTFVNASENITRRSGSYFMENNQLSVNYFDDFSDTSLDDKWIWHEDSLNSCSWTLSANPGYFRITCLKVSMSWQSGILDIPYLGQNVPSGDWVIEVHLNEPTNNEFANGIILVRDASHWLIFANHVDSVGEMNLLRMNNGSGPDNVAGGSRGNNKPYLRLNKTGFTYYCYGSDDGNAWESFGNWTSSTLFNTIGIWGQSAYSGTFISDFNYVKISCESTENNTPSGNNDLIWLLNSLSIIIGISLGISIFLIYVKRNFKLNQ